LRKASRSATEKEDSENLTSYLWLFRTRMPMHLPQGNINLGNFVGNQVEAQVD
jgi:hypothetical protein